MNGITLKSLPAILLSLLLIPGCIAGITVDHEGISRTRRIAVVSVAMTNAADTGKEKNRRVLQEGADRALTAALKRLRSIRTWNVADPASYQNSRALSTFGAPTDAELAVLLKDAGERGKAREQLTALRGEWKDRYLGVRGLPIVPRSAVSGQKKGQAAGVLVRTVITAQAVSLCTDLKVDAVALLEVSLSISHPRSEAFIVKDNRTDGRVRMAQTLVIIDRSGAVIADLGEPRLTDGAATEEYLPIYLGSGKDAVRDENIDLADQKGRIAKALYSLVNESSGIMFSQLGKAVAK